MMGVLPAIRAAGVEPDLAVQDAAERLDHTNSEHDQQRGVPPVLMEPRTPVSYRSLPPGSICQNRVHSCFRSQSYGDVILDACLCVKLREVNKRSDRRISLRVTAPQRPAELVAPPRAASRPAPVPRR